MGSTTSSEAPLRDPEDHREEWTRNEKRDLRYEAGEPVLRSDLIDLHRVFASSWLFRPRTELLEEAKRLGMISEEAFACPVYTGSSDLARRVKFTAFSGFCAAQNRGNADVS
jgi:hypothetical protein